MRGLGIAALVACSALGCSASRLGAYREAGPTAASPAACDVARLLPSATEDDWHKESDAGNLKFDEEGLLITAKKKPKAETLIEVKKAAGRVSLRAGAWVGIDVDDGSDFFETDGGPAAGASLLLGSKTASVTFEVGLDYSEVSGRYYDYSMVETGSFSSQFILVRGDVLVFVNGPASSLRFYASVGGRYAFESAWSERNDFETTFNNTGTGMGFGLGMKSGRFDFRLEINEIGGENSFSSQGLMAAMSF